MMRLVRFYAIVAAVAMVLIQLPVSIAQDNTTVSIDRMVNGWLETRLETLPGNYRDNIDNLEVLSTLAASDDLDQYTGQLLWQTGDTYGMCNDCAVSPEGGYFGLGITLNNQRGEFYESASPTPLWQYWVGEGAAKVALSQDASLFAFAYEHYLSIFENGSGTPSWTYDYGASAWAYPVAVTRDGSLIVASYKIGDVGYIAAFDPASLTPLWENSFTLTTGFPWYGLRICADGTRISANSKFEAWILDAATGDVIWETNPNNTESPIPMSADGSVIAIGLNAGGHCYVYTWNPVSGTYDQLWSYTFTGGYSRWCNEVEISADGNTVGAGSLEFIYGGEYDGHAAVFDTWGGGTPLWISDSFGDLVGEIAMSDDGSIIAVGSWGDLDNATPDLRIYERSSSTPFFTVNHPGSINSVDMSTDGSIIFAGGKHVHNRIGGNGGDAYAIAVEQSFPAVAIALMPYNPPIQIPATGGSFDFNVALENSDPDPATFDAWIMVQLPDLSWFGPVLGPINLTLPGMTTIERDRTQNVPAGAPSGTYTYEGRVGNYPDDIWASDSFPFEKLATGYGDVIGEWLNSGDNFPSDEVTEPPLPSSFLLFPCFPNPFNPSTTISFALPEAAKVNLSVYDISGRLITSLVDGNRLASYHETAFDASDLASGVYVYQIMAGDFTASGKMVLMK